MMCYGNKKESSKRKIHSTQIPLCKIDMHGEISYEIIRELTDRREQLEKTKRVREAF